MAGKVRMGRIDVNKDPMWLTIQDLKAKYGPGTAKKVGPKGIAMLASVRDDYPKVYKAVLNKAELWAVKPRPKAKSQPTRDKPTIKH